MMIAGSIFVIIGLVKNHGRKKRKLYIKRTDVR